MDGARISVGAPELADMAPVPQSDGPCPMVTISYRDDFREAMDYFRAFYAAGKRSPRAIHLNPSNYTIWHFRRVIIEALDADLLQELPAWGRSA